MARERPRQTRIGRLLASVVIATCAAVVQANSPSLEFEALGIDDGLSQSGVNAIAQDGDGFLWFGTEDGLNRYDGYQFRIYRPDDEAESGLANGFIWALHVDTSGVLWVGSDDGLQWLDKQEDKFATVTLPLVGAKAKSPIVRVIIDDGESGLWIGTQQHGLIRASRPGDGVLEAVQVLGSDIAPHIQALMLDRSGQLWVASSSQGLMHYDHSTGELQRHRWPWVDEGRNAAALSLHETDDGRLYVGTSHGWIGEIDRRGESRRIELPRRAEGDAGLRDRPGRRWCDVAR